MMTRRQSFETVEQFGASHHRDAEIGGRCRCEMLLDRSISAFDDVTGDVCVQHVPHQSSSRKSGLRSFDMRFMGRSFIQSWGMSMPRTNSKNSSQTLAPGRLDKMTSCVRSSREMYTWSPSKPNSACRRTAWLAPFLKSLAMRVCDMGCSSCAICIDCRDRKSVV